MLDTHCTALQQGVPLGEISLLYVSIHAVSAGRTEAFIFVQRICHKISLKSPMDRNCILDLSMMAKNFCLSYYEMFIFFGRGLIAETLLVMPNKNVPVDNY